MKYSAPTLSWQGINPFLYDGIDPSYGTPGTQFVFRVKYKDPNNDPPNGSPTLTIKRGTAVVYSERMDSIVDGEPGKWAKGVVYEKILGFFNWRAGDCWLSIYNEPERFGSI